MKLLLPLFALLLLASCAPTSEVDSNSAAHDLFAQNSKTAMALIRDFDNEDLTAVQAHFADSAWWRPTKFGQTDTMTLADKISSWEKAWARYDFNLATEEVRLLPGVNAETRAADGSVRVYFDWDYIRAANDSMEAKTVQVSIYEAWEFNEDGKIWMTQIYGDVGAAMAALNE